MFTPSLIPVADDTVYIVEDDFGDIGRVYRETDSHNADRETILRDLSAGQYHDPVRVVALNRVGRAMSPTNLRLKFNAARISRATNFAEFVEFYTRPARQLSLRLA